MWQHVSVRCCLLVLVVILLDISMLNYLKQEPSYVPQHNVDIYTEDPVPIEQKITNNRTIHILFWNSYFNWPYYDKHEFDTVDAVVFHGNDLYNTNMMADLEKLKQQRTKQKFVFFTKESPRSGPEMNYEVFNNCFNLTMTYRLDADVNIPYGRIVKRHTDSKNSSGKYNVNDATPSKWMQYDELKVSDDISGGDFGYRNKDIAWIVSHCKTDSLREKYVNDLREATKLQIDVYGKCGDKEHRLSPEVKDDVDSTLTSREDLYKKVLSKYKFYLSFENTFCQDYITEKFFLAMNAGALPIVYGGANKLDYQKVSPPRSYINTEDFPSTKHLASHLEDLANNHEAYNSYSWWTQHYETMSLLQTQKDAYCRLCEKLNEDANVEYKKYTDWSRYWNEMGKCRDPPFWTQNN